MKDKNDHPTLCSAGFISGNDQKEIHSGILSDATANSSSGQVATGEINGEPHQS